MIRFSLQSWISQRLSKFSWSQEQLAFILSLLLGGICGFLAILLLSSIHAVEWVGDYLRYRLARTGYPWLGSALPALGGLLVGLIMTFLARGVSSSGVPEVKVALHFHQGVISLRSAIGKFLVSAISLGSGISLGREGPTLQISAGIGSFLSRCFRLDRFYTKNLVGVGAAAGLAAAFNAPIAAVTYILEELMKNFHPRILGPTFLGAVIAAMMERITMSGGALVWNYGDIRISPLESVYFAVVGLVAAFLAPLVNRFFLWCLALFRRLPGPLYVHTCLGGLSTGVIGLYYPQVLGMGYSGINAAVQGVLNGGEALQLLGAKAMASSLAYGSGVPGGLFAPVLFIGSMMGSAIGSLVKWIAPAGAILGTGPYALVGMGALFAGIFQAPITAIFFVFEITGSYPLILPLMLACAISSMVSRSLQESGFYDLLLEQRGIRLPNQHDLSILSEMTAGDTMSGSALSFSWAMTVQESLELVSSTKWRFFPVLDEEGRLEGMISETELRKAMNRKEGSRLLLHYLDRRNLQMVEPDQSLAVVMEKLAVMRYPALPVVNSEEERKVVGIITTRDIMRAYARSKSSAHGLFSKTSVGSADSP